MNTFNESENIKKYVEAFVFVYFWQRKEIKAVGKRLPGDHYKKPGLNVVFIGAAAGGLVTKILPYKISMLIIMPCAALVYLVMGQWAMIYYYGRKYDPEGKLLIKKEN